MSVTSTRTFATLFDSEVVDRLCGELHRELESDYLKRKPYIHERDRLAIEARLALVRSTWTMLLDRSTA